MTTNLNPRKSYISKRMFDTITAYLDLKGVLTKVVKTKRRKNYFIYVQGRIYGKNYRTRQSSCRAIHRIFKAVVNGTFDITK